jgi:hypothetical protein
VGQAIASTVADVTIPVAKAIGSCGVLETPMRSSAAAAEPPGRPLAGELLRRVEGQTLGVARLAMLSRGPLRDAAADRGL